MLLLASRVLLGLCGRVVVSSSHKCALFARLFQDRARLVGFPSRSYYPECKGFAEEGNAML